MTVDLQKAKSSKDIQESYIPVVNVEIPKNDTAPKSDNVQLPMIIQQQ